MQETRAQLQSEGKAAAAAASFRSQSDRGSKELLEVDRPTPTTTMASVAAGLLLLLLLLLLLQHQALAAAGDRGEHGAATDDDEDLQYRRRHRRYRHGRTNAPPSHPSAQPGGVQVQPPPPPPSPSTRRELCNRTYGPDEALTVGGDVCVPLPPSPPVAPPPPLPRVLCPPAPPCVCPKQPQPQQPLQPLPPRPFPWWPVPRRGGGGGGSSSSNAGEMNCVTALAGLSMNCGTFVTGNETGKPTPTSECCSALTTFLHASTAAATARGGGGGGGGDNTLRCLCPVILGQVNKVMQKPVDPVRMMYLPIACGVVLPPQVLYICFTSPPVVTDFQERSVTETDSSPAVSLP